MKTVMVTVVVTAITMTVVLVLSSTVTKNVKCVTRKFVCLFV